MKSKDIFTRKMIAPLLPQHLITTERIARLYLEMQAAKTVSVNAPTGYGKTALIASFFNSLPDGNRILWYRVEPKDNNPGAFFSFLLEELICSNNISAVIETAKEKSQKLLNHKRLVEFACDELWKTYDPTNPKYIHLAFNECQNLEYSSIFADLLRQLANNGPPLLKIYFLSRNSQSIIDEKHKLENKHLQISMSDLQFSKQELSALLKAMNYDFIDEAQLDNIFILTEGWIGATLILIQALKPYEGQVVQLDHYLEKAPGLYRYLSMDLFSKIEKADLEKLCRLSLLSGYTEESAASIYDLHDLENEFLKYPELDMFVSLVGENPIYYRFNNLIKQYLRKYAKALFSKHQLAELHFKAAVYYIERELFSQAIEHIKNCTALEKTIELVTGVGIRFMLVGNSGQLNKWLSMLPQELVSFNPVLLIFKALLLPQNEFKEAGRLLSKAYHYSIGQKNPLLLYRSATSLVFIYYCKNNMRGIVSITNKTVGNLQALKNDSKSWLNLLTLMNAIGKNKYVQGLEYAGNLDVSDLQEEDYWLYLAYSAIIYLYLGKLESAEKQITKALTLDSVDQTEPAKATALYLFCYILAMQNRFDLLESKMMVLKQISEKNGYSYYLAGVKHLSAYVSYINFKYEEAQAILDEAVFACQEFGNQAQALLLKMIKRLWSSQEEKGKIIMEEIAWEVEMLKKLKPGLMVEEIYQSIQGALARETGDLNFAEKCLRQSIKKAKTKKAGQVVCGSYFHLSKLYFDMGNRKQGCNYLKKAMMIGEEGSYYMLWDIHLPTIVEMLIRAVIYKYNPGYAEEFLKRLLNDNIAAFIMNRCTELNDGSVPAYTRKLLADLKENPGKKFYHIQAKLFGKPDIQVNGLSIPESSWKTKKNRGIVEYLILCKGEAVSKERIIDLFWPDSDVNSALTSLRTALYQIRKNLASYGVDFAGNSSLFVETHEVLEIKTSDEVVTDLATFDNLYYRVLQESLKKNADINFIQETLETVVFLYRGELLETRDYGDILLFKREKCKTVFEDACLRLSSIYYEKGKLNLAETLLERAILADPYSENTCLALAKVYVKAGKRNKAQKLFNDFKKRLKVELNIEPENSLAAVIEGIIKK